MMPASPVMRRNKNRCNWRNISIITTIITTTTGISASCRDLIGIIIITTITTTTIITITTTVSASTSARTAQNATLLRKRDGRDMSAPVAVRP